MRSSSTGTSSTRTRSRRRTPGTPLVAGALLEAGPLVAEIGAAVLYALSILAWCAVARRFGPAAAIATAAALLLYPGYVMLFHQLSSDAVFAAAFALVAWLLARALERTERGACSSPRCSSRRTCPRASGRPGAPPPRARPPLRRRDLAHADSRLRGVRPCCRRPAARMGGAQRRPRRGLHAGARWRSDASPLPCLRRGSHRRAGERPSHAGARARRRARPPTLRAVPLLRDRPRARSSPRAARACTRTSPASPTVCGAGTTTTGSLRKVGREAVLAHPGTYAKGVASDLRRLLVWPLYAPTPGGGETQGTRVPIADRQLPVPGEGEPIPSARQSSYITTPDQQDSGGLDVADRAPHRLLASGRRGAGSRDRPAHRRLERELPGPQRATQRSRPAEQRLALVSEARALARPRSRSRH